MSPGEAFDDKRDVALAVLRQHSGDAAHQAGAKVASETAGVDKETASVMVSCQDALHALPSGGSKISNYRLENHIYPGAEPGRRSGHGDRCDGEALLVSLILPDEDKAIVHQRTVR